MPQRPQQKRRVEAKPKPSRQPKPKPAAQKEKAAPKRQRGDIEFPNFQDLKVCGDSKPWEWARAFVKRLKDVGVTPSASPKKVNMFTEFSGSACAEVAAQSVASALGVTLKVTSAGDVDPQCRRVIMQTRLELRRLWKELATVVYVFLDPGTCVFGDILDLLPDDVRENAINHVHEKAQLYFLQFALNTEACDILNVSGYSHPSFASSSLWAGYFRFQL